MKLKAIAILLPSVMLLSGCSYINKYFNAQQEAAPIKSISTVQRYYIVKEGDSLYDLSQRFNVTERTLILWNKLKSPYTLTPGSKIRVAPLPGEKYYRADQAPQYQSKPVESSSNNLEASQPESKADTQRQPVVDSSAAPVVKQSSAPALSKKVSSATPEKEDMHRGSAREDAYPVLPKEKTKRHATAKVKAPEDGIYIVQSGDSLSAIATRYNVRLSELQKWNDISQPSLIYVGQKIYVVAPKTSKSQPQSAVTVHSQATSHSANALSAKKLGDKNSGGNNTKSYQSKEVKDVKVNANKASEAKNASTVKPHSTETQAATKNTSTSYMVDGISWYWPVKAKIDLSDSKMINVAQGTSVYAAADGKVIYAGVGMGGYGKMVILSHQSGYISAYSNLQSISVSESQTIKHGQVLGSAGKFHGQSGVDFEIRQNGQVKALSHFFS